MSEKNVNPTATATATATEEVPAKKTQVSTTLTPTELARLQEARWQGRHDKLSDVVHAAIIKYLDSLGV